MEIYVSYGGWDYGGNDDPVYCGDSIELAKYIVMKIESYNTRYVQSWLNGALINTMEIYKN